MFEGQFPLLGKSNLAERRTSLDEVRSENKVGGKTYRSRGRGDSLGRSPATKSLNSADKKGGTMLGRAGQEREKDEVRVVQISEDQDGTRGFRYNRSSISTHEERKARGGGIAFKEKVKGEVTKG